MKKFLIILAFAVLPVAAFAWGQQGHRIIGEIADRLLEKKAQKQINAILGDAGTAMVANWGDFIKSDTTYNKYNDWHYTNFSDSLTRREFDSLMIFTNYSDGKCVQKVIELTNHLK
jgi:hypothetical protein